MKVKVCKELSKLSKKELKESFNDCAKDVYFSTGQGLDFYNASNRMKEIKKEVRLRKINLNQFIDEIEYDIMNKISK